MGSIARFAGSTGAGGSSPRDRAVRAATAPTAPAWKTKTYNPMNIAASIVVATTRAATPSTMHQRYVGVGRRESG